MNEAAPTVSVIMNCYNGEEFLQESICSVLNQTYQSWELIFWDNQSSDNSKQIFDSFDDSRLRYFFAPSHTVLYEARNLAIDKAEGQYLAFLDVDDLWEANKLDKQVPLFNDPEVGFVCSNYFVKHELKKKSWKAHSKSLPSGYVTDGLLNSYFIGLLTLMIRKDAFDSLDYGFDPKFHVMGDLDITTRLSLKWKLGSSQETLAICRKHGNNALVQHREKHIEELEYWIGKVQKIEEIVSNESFDKLEENLTYQKTFINWGKSNVGTARYYLHKSG